MVEFMSAKEKAAEGRLRNKCFENKLNKRDTEICVDYFIKRLSHKEIANKYHIAVQTSLNKKARLKTLLKGGGR